MVSRERSSKYYGSPVSDSSFTNKTCSTKARRVQRERGPRIGLCVRAMRFAVGTRRERRRRMYGRREFFARRCGRPAKSWTRVLYDRASVRNFSGVRGAREMREFIRREDGVAVRSPVPRVLFWYPNVIVFSRRAASLPGIHTPLSFSVRTTTSYVRVSACSRRYSGRCRRSISKTALGKRYFATAFLAQHTNVRSSRLHLCFFTPTSDQVRLPAEFKHINRRRKRN